MLAGQPVPSLAHVTTVTHSYGQENPGSGVSPARITTSDTKTLGPLVPATTSMSIVSAECSLPTRGWARGDPGWSCG